MGASRIEQLIEDIYEFVESCRMQPLSSTKVIVPKDELYDLLDELRLRTPDEIKRYQKIIANRDAIIADAEEKAAAILAEAGERANALLDESEIMQQAYYQADSLVKNASEEGSRIINEANEDAIQIRQGALAYTADMLTDAEAAIQNAYESSRTKYENLLNALRGNLDILASNKRELVSEPSPQETAYRQEAAQTRENAEQVDYDDDYEFDENTFLKGIDE
ncbi:ATPase [Anaerocolumna sp. AGMB13020]|uniref:ATPase n=1 Tax=Anaerocolumna sp. AGMB13020 TaxID=3081750 RepID=UPI002954EB68|nr:ATPase [Anaerocolumna sp. AGMB13020]WOO36372.1 ATPase [Anaerocolumna sp. AGMB13020]